MLKAAVDMHVNLNLLVGHGTPAPPRKDIILEKESGIKMQDCGFHWACPDPLANHNFFDLFKITVILNFSSLTYFA